MRPGISGRRIDAKTDNHSIQIKRHVRELATAHLRGLRVLDMFAGYNTLWSTVDTERYYGIEIVKGKGRNLYADNTHVVMSLDLSGFNVIDVDAYGIPLEQFDAILDNPTLQPGTVIIYTICEGRITGIPKRLYDIMGGAQMVKKCPTLFSAYLYEAICAYLYSRGIREIHEVQIKRQFNKHYGWFVYDGHQHAAYANDT